MSDVQPENDVLKEADINTPSAWNEPHTITVQPLFVENTELPLNETQHVLGFPPPPVNIMPPVDSRSITATAAVDPATPEEIVEMNTTCQYCGLEVLDWTTHTCTGFLQDVYREGDTFLINNNMHALVLKNGEEVTYFQIAPGLLHTMDIQTFDEQVKANVPEE